MKPFRNIAHFVIATIVLTCAMALSSCNEAGPMGHGPSRPSQNNATPTSELLVRFIDVGQGDCALISNGDHHLLIDGGPSSESRKVYAILKSLGINHLDAIVATHPDADHIGGIPGALNYASMDRCFCSTAKGDTKTFQSLVKYLDQRNCTIEVPEVNEQFLLGEADVTFIGPLKQYEGDNNNSLVLRIDFGQTSFLFTGDMEEEAEMDLLSSRANLTASVLKVAHHGSKHSSTTSFLKRVSPQFAVVSVGENTYGHPTEQALSRLEGIGARVLRTDQMGSITFVSDGANLQVTTGREVTR